MTAGITPSGSPQPMRVGEIIKSGWQFYLSHFSQIFLIAIKGLLWASAPAVVALVAIALFVQQLPENMGTVTPEAVALSYAGVFVLATVALIVFAFYCTAQSLGYLSAISRLCYQSISGVDESEQAAVRFTRSRKFPLLWSLLLQGLIFLAAYIAVFVVMTIYIAIAAVALGAASANGSPGAVSYFLIGLVGALLLLAAICLLVWVLTRLMLTQMPLAIETQSGITQAISRSWQVTQKNVGRCLLVVILAFLIMLPISILAYLVGVIITNILFGAAAAAPGDSPASVVAFTLATLVSTLIGIAGSVVTTPLWQSIVGALYFDLRSRHEQARPTRGSVTV